MLHNSNANAESNNHDLTFIIASIVVVIICTGCVNGYIKYGAHVKDNEQHCGVSFLPPPFARVARIKLRFLALGSK